MESTQYSFVDSQVMLLNPLSEHCKHVYLYEQHVLQGKPGGGIHQPRDCRQRQQHPDIMQTTFNQTFKQHHTQMHPVL